MRSAPTWRRAAEDLAHRVGRRDRLSRRLTPTGVGLLAGGLLAVLLRLAGTADALAWGGAVLGLAAGALAAARRQGAPPRAGRGDAAWALDRIAGAGERGLAAATLEGAAAAEAAWAEPRPVPPRVALLPPRGLAPLVAGLAAVALALVVPARGGPAAARAGGAGTADAEAAAPGAEAARADALEQEAEAAARVRRALGLDAAAAADPTEVAERLADPDALAAARAAAGDGALGDLLEGGEAASEDVAGALREGAGARERAREARRASVAARAAGGTVVVPPGRRALLERYARARLAEAGEPENGALR